MAINLKSKHYYVFLLVPRSTDSCETQHVSSYAYTDELVASPDYALIHQREIFISSKYSSAPVFSEVLLVNSS